MKNNSLKWLWRVTGRKKYYVAALMLVQALNGGSGVLYALFLRNIVDSAVAHDRTGFFKNCVYTAILVLGQVMLSAMIRYLEEQSRSSLENQLKSRLFHNVLHKDYSSVSAVHSGEWLNRLTSDCMVVANNFTDILPGAAGMIVKLVSAAVMIVALEPKFAAVLIPVGFVLLFFTYAFRKNLKKLHRQIQEKDGKLRIYLQEHIGSMMMIRSFATEDQTEAEAAEKMKAHKSARMKKNRFSNMCNIGFQSGMQGMYLLGVCYCGYGILTGAISYGTLTAVTQLISQIQSPFANITGYLPKFYAMTASAERIMEIEKFTDDSENAVLPAKEVNSFYENEMKGFGIRDAEFTYYPVVDRISDLTKEEMPLVLENISVDIRKGEYVAFTGHSGCGKSTVLKLLMSVYRLDGGIRYLEGTEGEKTLSAEWRRLFAYVPQGNQLFSGTIRETISFADKTASSDDERIENALKIACADEFVSELEQGTDTLLGERGAGLSEGQMQRIAIARAVFSDCPVLLLDEATSALDELTERKVLENLKTMTNKTVVIVTHRPAALDICDRILQFTENGVTEKHG
ncbi:MAG: ABC transporter ATP-binding protein [Oscillospiraceae bacterium]|nr:ABC transporter ATP-binding protein [Oscillospiraceae bacterium]